MIIKKYLSNLKLSITSVNYYIEILKEPLRNSFFFFITSMILLGMIKGANISLTELPKIKDESYIALDELNKHFDASLEIIWADDQLELNQEYIDVPWPSRLDYESYGLPSTLALFSNSETPPAESNLLETSSPLIYINKNNLYTLSEINEQQWTEYPLNIVLDGNELGSFSINKQNLPRIISSIKETIDQSFAKIQFIGTAFSAVIFIFSRFLFLITESILVYFLFKIYSFNFSFKKILKLSLNILVPTEIIHVTSGIFYKDLNFPMDSIAFWVILSFISFHLIKIRKKKINL